MVLGKREKVKGNVIGNLQNHVSPQIIISIKAKKKKTIKHYLRNAPLFFFTLGKYVIVCTHPQISLGKSSQGE